MQKLKKTKRLALAVLMALVAIMVMLPIPVAFANPYPSIPELEVASTEVIEVVVLKGTDFLRSRNVAITFDGDNVITVPLNVRTNYSGDFSCIIGIPEGTEVGEYEIVATTSYKSATIDVEVISRVGPQGERGPRGRQGEDGEDGETGPQGEVGLQGETGPKGLRGTKGVAGDDGRDGEDGLQGPQGLQGEQGERGLMGPMGPTGLQGLQGEAGEDGRDGVDGAIGAMGATGYPDLFWQFVVLCGVIAAIMFSAFALLFSTKSGKAQVK